MTTVNFKLQSQLAPDAVLSALMADPSAWRVVEAAAEPVRRVRGHAGAMTGLGAAAYRPELS